MLDDQMEEGLSEEEAVAAVGPVDEIVRQIIADTPLAKLAKERMRPRRQLKAWEIVLLVLGSPLWLSLGLAAIAVIFAFYVVLWSVSVSLWAVFASRLPYLPQEWSAQGWRSSVLRLPGRDKGHFDIDQAHCVMAETLLSQEGGRAMSRKTKIWLITAAALVLAGCLLFAGTMAAQNWDFSKLSTVTFKTNTYEIDESFSSGASSDGFKTDTAENDKPASSDSSANDPTNTFITNTYEIGGSFRDIAVATDIADVSFVPSEDGICRVECYEAENAKHTVAVEAETW